MAGNYRRNDFADRESLAAALAETVAGRLSDEIRASQAAGLAVSGGSTPARFFEVLSNTDIAWDSVNLTLIDERYVPDTSPRSNAALVKAKLKQNKAASANFLPLYGSGNLDADMKDAGHFLSTFFNPPDVAILGMGNDGHTASFFPDAKELEHLLDPASRDEIAAVHADSAGELRLTLTLALIRRARFIALHIEGAEKQATLEKALAPGSHLPIRRVIDAATSPVEIFWAP